MFNEAERIAADAGGETCPQAIKAAVWACETDDRSKLSFGLFAAERDPFEAF